LAETKIRVFVELVVGSMTDWPAAHKPYIPSSLISHSPTVQQKSGYFSLQSINGRFAFNSVNTSSEMTALGIVKLKQKTKEQLLEALTTHASHAVFHAFLGGP
jgi:hypothetical protein